MSVTLKIELDHVDSTGAVFTMTVAEDANNTAAGTYRVEINKPITLNLPVGTQVAT